jgi:hypothetical protein
MRNNERKKGFESKGNYLCDKLVDDIAQHDWMEIASDVRHTLLWGLK